MHHEVEQRRDDDGADHECSQHDRSLVVNGPGHGAPAPRPALAHLGDPDIRALAMPACLPVRADRAVTGHAAAGSFLRPGHIGILGPMTSPAVETVLCACGCGQRVTSKGARWRRGHFHYGEGGWPGPDPLPGPGDPIDLDQALGVRTANGAREVAEEIREDLGGQDAGIGPDPPPAPLRSDPPRSTSSGRVTAAIRRDINAKISLPLEVLGQGWKIRDPFCGGRFVEQRPAIADALTGIVCESADLVDWFTGPGGGFMTVFKLAAACWPVAEMAIAHHVTHTVGEPRDQAATGPRLSPADLMAQYPA